MIVTTERREDFFEARDLPPEALAAYRRFWRLVRRNADELEIEIPPPLRNAIRNSWRNGYWTGKDT